jgi:hypothetical protein
MRGRNFDYEYSTKRWKRLGCVLGFLRSLPSMHYLSPAPPTLP